MDQSTNKTTNESDFTSSIWKNCAILGAVLFVWQQTIAWVICKTGTLLTDVVCFEVLCLKSLLICFHTFIKSWSIDIRHLFLARRHTHKIKTKFSRWTNFSQHKLCLGEIRPFCLPIAFTTSLTVTWRSGTCWQLKGVGKYWPQPKGGRGKQWNERNHGSKGGTLFRVAWGTFVQTGTYDVHARLSLIHISEPTRRS